MTIGIHVGELFINKENPCGGFTIQTCNSVLPSDKTSRCNSPDKEEFASFMKIVPH